MSDLVLFASVKAHLRWQLGSSMSRVPRERFSDFINYKQNSDTLKASQNWSTTIFAWLNKKIPECRCQRPARVPHSVLQGGHHNPISTHTKILIWKQGYKTFLQDVTFFFFLVRMSLLKMLLHSLRAGLVTENAGFLFLSNTSEKLYLKEGSTSIARAATLGVTMSWQENWL